MEKGVKTQICGYMDDVAQVCCNKTTVTLPWRLNGRNKFDDCRYYHNKWKYLSAIVIILFCVFFRLQKLYITITKKIAATENPCHI